MNDDSALININSDRVFEALCNGKGFHVLPRLSSTQLDKLWGPVLDSFSSCFALDSPDKEDMKNIHLREESNFRFASLSVWDRTLNMDSALELVDEQWMKNLCTALGYYPIDSYGHGYPSFTWRLMRPGQSQDLRGLHRDVWFRTASGGPAIIDSEAPVEIQTIKAWVALNVESNKSGLLVSPCSQLDSMPTYQVVRKDNLIKPSVVESEIDNSRFQYADTSNGNMVLFGEQLMHGGAPTCSDSSRVSLEFTLARKEQTRFQTFIDANSVKSKKLFPRHVAKQDK